MDSMDNHKRRFVTSTEVDRISNLPDNLIDSILERLPVQDAVRTSVLSKNWSYRWTTMRSLVLDKHFSEKVAKNGAYGRNGFIRITNQLFNFLTGPILKLHLHIPNMVLDSFQEVDQWILSLSRDGVRELVLTNLNQRYRLPSYLFRCLELRKLQRKNCIFKPPLELPGFLYLEDVFLINIEFGVNLCRTVINLPQIKRLHMVACTNVYNFNIKATKLQTLFLDSCPDALSLLLLRYLASFATDGNFLKFSAAEKIPKWLPRTANYLKLLCLINLNFGDLDQLQGALCILRNSPNLERLFVKNVQMGPQDMHFDLKPAISVLEAPDCLDQTLNLLKTIDFIHVEGSRPLLLFIKLFLDHSPTLEKMSIRPSVTANAHEKHNFAKDVMRFPRASTKAEVLYLDP